jgi:hypothetical protein
MNDEYPSDVDDGFPALHWIANVGEELREVGRDFAGLTGRLRTAQSDEHRWLILAEDYEAISDLARLVRDLALTIRDTAPPHIQRLMKGTP